ncbi:MAG: N-acetylmuramoyl-L-alanine amidase, partial [Alphaproteobacteria bacterium]
MPQRARIRTRLAALQLCVLASAIALWSPEATAKAQQVVHRHRAAVAAHQPRASKPVSSQSNRLPKTARTTKVRPVSPQVAPIHRVVRDSLRSPTRVAKAAPKAQKASASRNNARLRRALMPLVLIDPGHGGRDGGAVGLTGLLEKDVTLSTALELQRELRAQGRFRVELTRTADVGISLANRLARARTQQPALLISIHADASSDPRAHGASVYVRAEPDQGTTVKLPATPAASGAISRALSTGTANPPPGSSDLQKAMVEQLKDDVAMVHDPAREAHLYVLATSGVPSVLVEMGFVSNRHEERPLRTTRYRRT